MNLVVSVTGVVIGLLAAVGIFAPLRVVGWLRGLSPSTRYWVAIVQRAILGALFIWAAPSCRTPRIIYGLGVLTVVAALVILLMGPRRLDALVERWVSGSATLLAASFAGLAVFGCFLVYAAW